MIREYQLKSICLIFILLGAAISACSQVTELSATAETTQGSESPTAHSTPTTLPDIEPAPTEPAQEATQSLPTSSASQDQSDLHSSISDLSDFDMLYSLIGENKVDSNPVIDSLLSTGDERFIPVFIELLRASDIGIVNPAAGRYYVEVLQALSGQPGLESWADWVEWYGKTEIQPPEGFTGWKGVLLARIDPGFAAFLQDEYPVRIRPEEIVWGGVPVDGIPALDNPKMIPAEQADYLLPDEAVFGISLNGDSRAYPLRIMDWHEMANDVIGGVPVSLAYCTLCGAGIAFDGRISNSDSARYDFGSSGFLYRSNKLMYDRQTRTLWNQFTGEPVLGPLADQDIRLELLPVVLTSWEAWQVQHPNTVVLEIDTGFDRPYEIGAAYADYFADDGTMFPVWQRSGLLPPKERIFALRVGSIPKAYPLDTLVDQVVVNDQIGDTPVVLIAQKGIVDSQGRSYRSLPGSEPLTYQSGAEVRAYQRGDETFAPGKGLDQVLDSSGLSWMVTEEALVGANGDTLARVPGHLAYWFGWYAFFPNTLLYEVE